MHAMFAIGIGLAYVTAFALGLWLGRGNRKAFLAAFAAGFALIGVRVVFELAPAIEYCLSAIYAYTLIQPWWPRLAAFLFLGLAITRVKRRLVPVLAAACAGALFIVSGQIVASRALFNPSQCEGVPGEDGLCQQTTSFTCGAAAASTLLARFGVQSNEREMALLCWTNDWTGTDRFSICKALHQKLDGTPYTPRLITANWERLAEQGSPSLVVISLIKAQGLELGLDHWVVVLDVTETEAHLADPIGGLRSMSRDAFLEDWRHFALIVE